MYRFPPSKARTSDPHVSGNPRRLGLISPNPPFPRRCMTFHKGVFVAALLAILLSSSACPSGRRLRVRRNLRPAKRGLRLQGRQPDQALGRSLCRGKPRSGGSFHRHAGRDRPMRRFQTGRPPADPALCRHEAGRSSARRRNRAFHHAAEVICFAKAILRAWMARRACSMARDMGA